MTPEEHEQWRKQRDNLPAKVLHAAEVYLEAVAEFGEDTVGLAMARRGIEKGVEIAFKAGKTEEEIHKSFNEILKEEERKQTPKEEIKRRLYDRLYDAAEWADALKDDKKTFLEIADSIWDDFQKGSPGRI